MCVHVSTVSVLIWRLSTAEYLDETACMLCYDTDRFASDTRESGRIIYFHRMRLLCSFYLIYVQNNVNTTFV
jgi:hypothetical protein